MSNICWEEPEQPKICNFYREVIAEENFVAFDIAVDDFRSTEIIQCTCSLWQFSYTENVFFRKINFVEWKNRKIFSQKLQVFVYG